jgi:hypothetical protein
VPSVLRTCNRLPRQCNACGWIHNDEYLIVQNRGHGFDGEHGLDVAWSEALLQTVECKPTQLRLDEIRSVRHHDTQTLVLFRALPPRNQMQHVDAVCRLAVLFAFLTRQLYLQDSEHGQSVLLVLQAHQPRCADSQLETHRV